ncbi:hypothetical protein SteCoe_1735 [Stentor coeruleus]|uniref:Uncharacterized protein n=1 Tax=Stentor coeruleus TaxID=5963 RepID=A0A1R2D1A2_9CILI|nr:hypothetical protein SteCoe_1735 [Stentor coeruleus]
MDYRDSGLKTCYILKEKPNSALKHANKPFIRQGNLIRIGPLTMPRRSLDIQRLSNTPFIPKDYSTNTTFYNKKPKNQPKNKLSRSKKKIISLSPELHSQNNPKIINLSIEIEDKNFRYAFLRKLTHDRQTSSPIANTPDFKIDFSHKNPSKTVIHQYALPHALIPIRTPSPVFKIPNILDETIVPRPHPIIRKGLSGWKLSFTSMYMGHAKKKFNLLK